MSEHILEFSRIMIYLLGAVGLLYLAMINKPLILALLGISFQFALRSVLLFFQYNDYPSYRELNNWTSTPSILFAVILIYMSLYKVRKY